MGGGIYRQRIAEDAEDEVGVGKGYLQRVAEDAEDEVGVGKIVYLHKFTYDEERVGEVPVEL